jgi:hypothetical protein
LDELIRPCQEQALSLGIMMTPVLVFSGRVHHQGSVPSREQTKTWLSRTYAEIDENIHGQMIVEVLGPGCTNCEKVYQNTFEAMDRLDLNHRVKIVKITDIHEFAKKGVHTTPGLIINGKVASKAKCWRLIRSCGCWREPKGLLKVRRGGGSYVEYTRHISIF